MMLTGAEVILKFLETQKIDTIFGYPGGAVIPLYDELYKVRHKFNHIRCAHEQGCVHGADGYARVTGKVGVCIVTSGPGATNAVTGIATAYMDSVPLVIISGQVPTQLLGRDSFQEIDLTGITMSITKHNYIVKDVMKLPKILEEAFTIAKEGRPGPVLIDIPKDIFTKQIEFTGFCPLENSKLMSLDSEEIKAVAQMINDSKKPIIYAGGGVISSGAHSELSNLAKTSNIPVVNTLMGLGCFNRYDKLSLGIVGMHGFKEANLAVNNSDLIIALGARFSDRVIGKADEFAPQAKIIHVDIDNTEASKNIDSLLTIIGDVKEVLNQVMKHIKPQDRNQWLREVQSYKQEDVKNEDFTPKNILKTLGDSYKQDTIVVTDVGQHQMWTAQYWKFTKPRTFITSGGLGTMGFGLGAAIGAKIGKQDKRVVLITGDGSFRMNCNELSTLAKCKLPVIIVLFNNSTLGMVRQWQTLFSGQRYSQTDITGEVDYIKLAKAYGINGYKVDNLKGLQTTIEIHCQNDNEAVLVECTIDKDEMVLPIVPAGVAISEQIIG
ncbi:biosynthetic-type acetolactate synthase large subunit [Clostridiaceae bacterium M8S5]|nr:biosynthetic-type acetolactate synthase large subunit [Clostridiaceae bacterium M8S5]